MAVRFEYYDAAVESGVAETYLNKHGKKFGDCVARSLCAALETPYTQIIYQLALQAPNHLRRGADENQYGHLLRKKGWRWVKCKPAIRMHQLPTRGKFLCEMRDHITFVKDGVNYDNENWGRWAIQSYWTKK